MTEHEIDQRLRALLAEPPPAPDPAFSERVMALAAYEAARAQMQRRAAHQVAIETAALVAVLATFALLARSDGIKANLHGTLSLASPAMLGIMMLALWGLVVVRPALSER